MIPENDGYADNAANASRGCVFHAEADDAGYTRGVDLHRVCRLLLAVQCDAETGGLGSRRQKGR